MLLSRTVWGAERALRFYKSLGEVPLRYKLAATLGKVVFPTIAKTFLGPVAKVVAQINVKDWFKW